MRMKKEDSTCMLEPFGEISGYILVLSSLKPQPPSFSHFPHSHTPTSYTIPNPRWHSNPIITGWQSLLIVDMQRCRTTGQSVDSLEEHSDIHRFLKRCIGIRAWNLKYSDEIVASCIKSGSILRKSRRVSTNLI